MRWGGVAEVAEVWACRQNLTEVDSRAGLVQVWSRALWLWRFARTHAMHALLSLLAFIFAAGSSPE